MIGEALIDLIVRPGDADLPTVGGSPLNVAVGLSRLAVPSALHTHIGTDEYGVMIARHLDANQVDLVPGSVGNGHTSVARATINGDGAAHYRFDIAWVPVAVPSPDPAPTLVHTGSIAAVVEPGAAVVLESIERLRSSATISYDPNVRPALMGDPGAASDRIEALVRVADVVKASDEDVAWLYPGVPLTAVAQRWLTLGPAIVVITRGELGAHAATPAAAIDVIAPSVAVVDTIGAGDSFMAGLLAALAERGLIGRSVAGRLRSVEGALLRQIIEFAATCAGTTVSRLGADPPTRADLR